LGELELSALSAVRPIGCWLVVMNVVQGVSAVEEDNKSHLVFKYDVAIGTISHIPLLHGSFFVRCDLGKGHIVKVGNRMPVQQHQISYLMKCASFLRAASVLAR
jgi:hypothetical protein